MKISVCMAAYNGAKYIRLQLLSILNQLGPNDQLVVVDDGSTDNTVQIIKSFKDSRIQLHINTVNIGVVRTFDRALHLVQGDLIFLSDQDDLWYDNKISIIRKIFSSQDVDLIVHDAMIVEGNHIISSSLFKFRNSSAGVIKNIISNTYTGCCMAFKRDILGKVLPIPARKGIFHDAWIGIVAEYYGYKIVFIDVPLIEFNRHDRNTSTLKRRKIIRILAERIVLLLAIITHIIRVYFTK
ncbi:glycosyltransferase [bacterium]|nr:glycosyltransferase [bacterium]